MSLQVWLPFNGDLHNQGLSDLTVINHGATINNSGKIGKCYELDGINNYFNLNLTCAGWSEFSLTCWCYCTENFNSLFLIRGNNQHRIRIGSDGFSFRDNNNSSSLRTIDFNATIPQEKWTHLTCIYKRGEIFIYVNGILTNHNIAYYHDNSMFLSDQDEVRIGRQQATSGNSYYGGRINDFRIYDHALSAAEVTEIAKGLVLHYKLDNNGMGNENYWTNGKPQVDTWANSDDYPNELITAFARTSANYASYPTAVLNEYTEIKFLSTREQVNNGGIQLQKVQRYNDTFNGMCPILENLKTGEYFTLSYELYINSPVNVKFHLSKKINGTTTNLESSIFQVSTVNTWTKISQSIQITSDFDKSNITTEVDFLMARLSILNILGVTTSDEVIIKIRNIKLERGQEATSWTPARADFGHIDDNIIYDCSGYSNNGTIVGEVTAAVGSPRYQVATYMNNRSTANRIWSNKEIDFNSDNNLTVSFWAKCDKTVSQVLFAMPKLEFALNNTAAYINPATARAGFSTTNFITNQWNHIVVILSGTTYSCYINGIITTSAGGNNNWVHNNNFLYLFNRSYNNNYAANATISDFRVYATALTSEQIADLFHTSMSIDANGNAYARELIEL